MKRLLIALGALLVAGPSFAADEWTPCGGTAGLFGAPTTPAVAAGQCLEYQWTSGTTALQVNVTASEALLLFDANIASSSQPVTPAEIMVSRCMRGRPISAISCVEMLDANLDGTPGASSTQKAAIRLTRGLYRIEQAVAPSAVTAFIQVEGEK